MQPCHIQNPGTFRTQSIFKSLSKKMIIWHIQSHSIVKTVYSSVFKVIYGYSGILMHIQQHSQAWLGQVEWGRPLLFWKSENAPLFLWKKGPDYVHFWVKLSTENVVLIVLRIKNSKTPNSCVFDEIFIELS